MLTGKALLPTEGRAVLVLAWRPLDHLQILLQPGLLLGLGSGAADAPAPPTGGWPGSAQPAGVWAGIGKGWASSYFVCLEMKLDQVQLVEPGSLDVFSFFLSPQGIYDFLGFGGLAAGAAIPQGLHPRPGPPAGWAPAAVQAHSAPAAAPHTHTWPSHSAPHLFLALLLAPHLHLLPHRCTLHLALLLCQRTPGSTDGGLRPSGSTVLRAPWAGLFRTGGLPGESSCKGPE